MMRHNAKTMQMRRNMCCSYRSSPALVWLVELARCD